MAARRSKRLVIDASVARSVGKEHAIDPTSIYCREFLKAVRTICHQIVMTPEIGEEWQRHQSSFARQWLLSMTARRKVYRLGDVLDNDLRGRIEGVVSNERAAEAMRKDLRLIEAAIATDRIVISLDETARALFAAVVQSVGKLRNIVWVTPSRTEDELILWLENGARPEKRRLLGFRAEGSS
jgi:hypothetical protein